MLALRTRRACMSKGASVRAGLSTHSTHHAPPLAPELCPFPTGCPSCTPILFLRLHLL